jgi:hypothetical protein
MEYTSSLLNLVWVAISLAAFTWFLASTGRRQRCSRRGLMIRAIALALALVSLFPCISASDDSVRLELLNAQLAADSTGQSHWSAPHTSREMLATLVSLLEVLESAQVAAILAFAISLCLFALALAIHPESLDRFSPACPGRAPPRVSFLAA